MSYLTNMPEFVTPQSNLPLKPVTKAAAATITVATKLTFLTGTDQLETITPPFEGYHEVVLCFTDAAPGLFLTTGNLKTAYQPIQNRPVVLFYDPLTAKYWVMTVA